MANTDIVIAKAEYKTKILFFYWYNFCRDMAEKISGQKGLGHEQQKGDARQRTDNTG